MSPSCILGSFASHHGLLQDNPRGKEQGPAKPGQGAEVRDKLSDVDPMGTSVIPSLWGILVELGL